MIAKSTQLVLKRCRAVVAGELRGILEAHCHLDHRFKPRLDTLDHEVEPRVKHLERLLAAIAHALAPRAKHVKRRKA